MSLSRKRGSNHADDSLHYTKAILTFLVEPQRI